MYLIKFALMGRIVIVPTPVLRKIKDNFRNRAGFKVATAMGAWKFISRDGLGGSVA